MSFDFGQDWLKIIILLTLLQRKISIPYNDASKIDWKFHWTHSYTTLLILFSGKVATWSVKCLVSHRKIEQSSWKENQCANACLPIAPTSECFHANMERVWGTALSSIYIIIPTLFVIMAIILFISEVHFLQRFARRKRVRYTLYWILGIYPGKY